MKLELPKGMIGIQRFIFELKNGGSLAAIFFLDDVI
jgi:hypothetical protein